uniref:Uncharacterized protein n=1 Tax=Cannabis sativa TaxID=3483 RepID=A0A803PR73_CANSA
MPVVTDSLKLPFLPKFKEAYRIKKRSSNSSQALISNMLGSWRQKYCLFFILLIAFIDLSEASRLPKEYFKQMMPKKLPSPSSSPSKGTNSVTTSSSKAVKADANLPSFDGKV